MAQVARSLRVVVTGGTGYLGSHLALLLAARGHRVTAVARGAGRGTTTAQRTKALEEAGVALCFADLSTPGDLAARCPTDAEVVVHGVCSFLEPTSGESLTLRAMDEALAHARRLPGLRLVVDLSNCLVLRANGPDDVADEDFPCEPDTRHGRNKLEAERRLEASGLPWQVLRIGQVYGGEGSSFDWVVLDNLRRRAMPVPCSGTNRVGLVHVDDVARGTLLAIESGVAGRRFNLCSGDATATQGEVFDVVADGLGVRRPRRIPRPAALAYAYASEGVARLRGAEPSLVPDMVRVLSAHRVLSIERARRELGYEPVFPRTLQGLRDAYADVFAGRRAPFVPEGRLAHVRGR